MSIRAKAFRILTLVLARLGLAVQTIKSRSSFENSVSGVFDLLLSNSQPRITSTEISCIIFSKDRPLQLYALLESILLNFSKPIELYVVYRCTSDEFKVSYNELINSSVANLLNLTWVEETCGFKPSLLDTLDKVKGCSIFFLTDDDLIIRKISVQALESMKSMNCVISLRHSLHLNYSFNENVKLKKQDFKSIDCKGYYVFNWFGSNGEWSDPLSLDGHIYPINEIKVLAKVCHYSAPNTFELALKSFAFRYANKIGICFEHPVVLNIPVNITQQEWRNKSGDVDLNYYLQQWRENKKLDISVMQDYIGRSTHELHYLPVVERSL